MVRSILRLKTRTGCRPVFQRRYFDQLGRIKADQLEPMTFSEKRRGDRERAIAERSTTGRRQWTSWKLSEDGTSRDLPDLEVREPYTCVEVTSTGSNPVFR